MITNNGKELIAKFLLGQAPAYATHIALGCGARPGVDLERTVTTKAVSGNVATLTVVGHGYRIGDLVEVTINDNTYNGVFSISNITSNTISYRLEHADNSSVSATGSVRLAQSDKPTMDYEMVRIPITSRGYINDDGVTQIVFAAEMPTTERFLITEASLWSAGSNANAQNIDSRHLYTFSLLEGWKYHHGETIEDVPFRAFLAQNPPDIDRALVGKCFITTNDTPCMTNVSRGMRYEPGRYQQHTVMLRGDSSKLLSTDSNSRFGIISPDGSYSNEHIHLDTIAVDLSKNNPNDEIRLAFSVVSALAQNPTVPAKTRVYVEFLHSEQTTGSGYARLSAEVNADDLATNRYVVMKKKLSDLITSGDFSWSKVRVVRIFASCYDATGVLDGNSYVAFDGMRLENLNSPNPVYSMTGYSVYNDNSTVAPQPIHKVANTSNYVEFRTNLGVI